MHRILLDRDIVRSTNPFHQYPHTTFSCAPVVLSADLQDSILNCPYLRWIWSWRTWLVEISYLCHIPAELSDVNLVPPRLRHTIAPSSRRHPLVTTVRLHQRRQAAILEAWSSSKIIHELTVEHTYANQTMSSIYCMCEKSIYSRIRHTEPYLYFYYFHYYYYYYYYYY